MAPFITHTEYKSNKNNKQSQNVPESRGLPLPEMHSDETHTLNAQNMIFVIFYDLSRSRSHTSKLENLAYIQVFLVIVFLAPWLRTTNVKCSELTSSYF